MSKLKSDILNTSKDLEHRKINENKVIEDNEHLKSRINILKYSESLRSSENKELVARLAQLEAKLQQDTSHDKQQAENGGRQNELFGSAAGFAGNCGTKTDCFTDSVQHDMIIGLCQRMQATRTRQPATTMTTQKYRDEMKEFINELFSRHRMDGPSTVPTSAFYNGSGCDHQQQSSATTRNYPRFRRRVLREDMWKDKQMEQLYEETKRIQASLLADIKKLSKGFVDRTVSSL